jgi:chemotaxis protein CheD
MAGSLTIASVFAQRIIIGVGDMAVSNNNQVILSTYALGSCVGVVAYDPFTKVGGILHLMLPDSKISPDKAAGQPAMFADTGLPLFFRSLTGLKADPRRLRLLLAGGASVVSGQDPFRIGERNNTVTLEFLRKYSLTVRNSDLGGSINRTLHLEMSTGTVTVKRPQDTVQCSLAN